MRLKHKIIVLAVLPLVTAVLAIAALVGVQARELARSEAALLEESMLAAKRTELRHYVQLGLTSIEHIYGSGRDATLSRIAALARRHGRFLLPRNANGLRQPVHVGDLADAAFAASQSVAARGRAYDLPGGETLPYRAMVGRVLECLEPPAKLLEWPMPMFRLALRAARSRGIARDLSEAAVRRMREDMVFDAEPARRDFGYAPRGFAPTADMFKPQP